MPVPISTMLFRRLVTEKSGVDAVTVGRVLDAEVDVLEQLLNTGATVRFNRLGALHKELSKPTRRRMPGADDLIEVPARERIVFRPARRESGDEAS